MRESCTYMQQCVSRCSPERACLAGIELRVFGYSATPSGVLTRVVFVHTPES